MEQNAISHVRIVNAIYLVYIVETISWWHVEHFSLPVFGFIRLL